MFRSSRVDSKLTEIKTLSNKKLKLTLVSVPFLGHCKILSTMAQKIILSHPDTEIHFIVTGWNNVTMPEDEINRLKNLGIQVTLLTDKENISSSAPMKFIFPRVVKLTDEVIRHCMGSDYIIYDFFSLEGWIAGKKLNIPTLCSMPAIMGKFNPENKLFQENLRENEKTIRFLENKYHIRFYDNIEMISDSFFIPSNFKTLIWTWPNFLKESKGGSSLITHRQETDKYVFIRPNEAKETLYHPLMDKCRQFRLEKKKIIYFSLGTVITKNLWNHEESVRAFINHLFAIILKNYGGNKNYEVIFSVGRTISDIDILRDKPENVHVYESVPQAELLKEVDLFITHAGGNSVNDAIDANTPMVAIPFFGDQHVCADYITKENIGIAFSHEEKDKERTIDTQAKLFFRRSLTEETLVSAIHAVLNDRRYKDNFIKLKSTVPIDQDNLIFALKNLKTLNWREGDLLYGCTPDRKKLTELTSLSDYFRIGDMRPFSKLFPNETKQAILPRIIDQYHDVLTDEKTYENELASSQTDIYRNTLQEYRAFLIKNPKYLAPIGDINKITPEKGRLYLETLWNMCLGGLEFFTTIKQHKIHFMIGMFNNKYSEAAMRELQWIKENWCNPLVRKNIVFYHINQGLLKPVDPLEHVWFSRSRPTPILMDVAPQKLNHANWKNLLKELKPQAQKINPQLFFNHLQSEYKKECYFFQESKLQILDVKKDRVAAKKALSLGETYIYALLPKRGLCLVKKEKDSKKISHAVLAQNQPVICAGEVRVRTIKVRGIDTKVLDISNDSGHYMPSTIGLPQVIREFETFGLPIYRVTGVHPAVRESFDIVSSPFK